MKVKVNVKEFMGLIEVLKKLHKTSSIFYRVFLLANEKEFLKVFIKGFEEITLIEFKLPAVVEVPGGACFKYDLERSILHSLLKNELKDKEITIENFYDRVKFNDIEIETIEFDPILFTCKGILGTNYEEFELDNNLMIKLIDSLNKLVPKKLENCNGHNHVFLNLALHFKNKKLNFIISDGYKLFVASYPWNKTYEGYFLIPSEIVSILAILAPLATSPFHFSCSKDYAIIKSDYFLICYKNKYTHQAKKNPDYPDYPDYEILLKDARKDVKAQAVLNIKQLQKLLKTSKKETALGFPQG